MMHAGHHGASILGSAVDFRTRAKAQFYVGLDRLYF